MRKPTARLYHDLRVTIPTNPGAYPVSIQFYFNGKRRNVRTGKQLTPDEFETVVSGSPRSIELKGIRDDLFALLHKAQIILKDIEQNFSLERAKNLLLDNTYQTDKNSLFTGFNDYIKELEGKGQIKTAISYETAKNSLKSFNPTLTYLHITPDLLEDYEGWLLFEKNLSRTTLGIYLRSLRTILNRALKKELISQKHYPFGKDKYIIPTGRNVKRALTIDDVRLIRDFFTVPNSPADRAKDFFLFSYLSNGINFKDIAQLKNKDIKDAQIHFVRAKTERTKRDYTPIKTSLRKETVDIIQKWRGPDHSPDAYLFPILEKGLSPKEQQAKIDLFIRSTNHYLKKMGIELNLSIKLTTYVARHSFATIAISKGGARIEEISDALGHSSLVTTRNYIDSFEGKRMKEITDSLL